MLKKTVPLIFAIAMLSILAPAVAAAELFPGPEQIPTLSQSSTGGKKPTADQAATGAAPFMDNGWEAIAMNCPAKSEGCSNCLDNNCCGTCAGEARSRKYTADVELLGLRTHFSEDPLGKLAEHYELSERIVLGAENEHGIGGRIRYWNYERTTPNLQGGSSLGADFSVTDLEGTARFGSQWYEIVLAGGLRFADIRLDIDSGSDRSNIMPGATFAVDLRTVLCGDPQSLEWHSVGGARWSVLGCDWHEHNTGLIVDTRDDNIMVTEIYGGFECAHCFRGHEAYARLVFEAQNWRSDALGENTGIDSIGFVGPGLSLGVNY